MTQVHRGIAGDEDAVRPCAAGACLGSWPPAQPVVARGSFSVVVMSLPIDPESGEAQVARPRHLRLAPHPAMRTPLRTRVRPVLSLRKRPLGLHPSAHFPDGRVRVVAERQTGRRDAAASAGLAVMGGRSAAARSRPSGRGAVTDAVTFGAPCLRHGVHHRYSTISRGAHLAVRERSLPRRRPARRRVNPFRPRVRARPDR